MRGIQIHSQAFSHEVELVGGVGTISARRGPAFMNISCAAYAMPQTISFWGRDLALYLGRKHCGLGLTELGESVGGLDYRTVSWAISRFGQRLSKDQKLAALAKKVARQIQNPEISPR